MEENDLIKLADEYAENIKLLDRSIAQCHEAIKQASENNRKAIVAKLKANVAQMYRQRRELAETENHLRYYYSAEEDKKAG
jgi:hypothetical protein